MVGDERAFPEQGCGGSFGAGQLNSIQHRYGLIVVQAGGLCWLADDCAWAYLRDLYDVLVVVSNLSCFVLAELVTYPAPGAHI